MTVKRNLRLLAAINAYKEGYRLLDKDEIVELGDQVLIHAVNARVLSEEEAANNNDWTSANAYVNNKVSECYGLITKRNRIFRREI